MESNKEKKHTDKNHTPTPIWSEDSMHNDGNKEKEKELLSQSNVQSKHKNKE